MLNVAILMGRLTADPELRHTQSGISVTSFSLAVDRRYTAGAEKQADFSTIVAWRQTAEFVASYFKKGKPIVVEGSIQTRKYQDKDGNNRTAFEVVASNVNFVEGSRDNTASGSSGYEQANAPAAAAAPASFSNTDGSDFTEFSGDDDLPF
ncbi:MAG: single-stranded DNA-binding protein [Oscillospiraceae bacterium]